MLIVDQPLRLGVGGPSTVDGLGCGSRRGGEAAFEETREAAGEGWRIGRLLALDDARGCSLILGGVGGRRFPFTARFLFPF